VGLKETSLARIHVLLLVAAAFAVLATSFWLGTRMPGYPDAATNSRETETATGSVSETPSPLSTAPTVSPGPAEPATPSAGAAVMPGGSDVVSPSPESAQPTKDSLFSNSFVGTLKLIIPVVGVKPEQLQDTFTDARSQGRAHDAIDIMAPAGTPVVAASDGEIVRLFQSERGGTTIYQLSPDKKLVFYYAHLQRYGDGLVVGKFARQGEVIGYVGDTGNAGAGNYHLHFSIAVLADPKRFWEGTNINPYPLLRR
jgi:murein DD-endopeptidase MepM/ murein hydrolase activator NlpD